MHNYFANNSLYVQHLWGCYSSAFKILARNIQNSVSYSETEWDIDVQKVERTSNYRQRKKKHILWKRLIAVYLRHSSAFSLSLPLCIIQFQLRPVPPGLNGWQIPGGGGT